MPRITTLNRSHEDAAVSLMLLAFSGDPATRWMYPDPAQYLTHYAPFVRLYAGAALDNGTAHSMERHRAIAMWLPPGTEPDEKGLDDLLRRSIEPARHAEVFDLVDRMAAYQPAEPHWFLPLIAVDPMCQRQGLGSALLVHMLAQFDRHQELAYLDSTNPNNVPLYERHGFERLGVIEAGSCPPVYPMLRRPR